MNEEIRRRELGKYFLDVSKYVLTVVVIGSLVSETVDVRALLIGLGIGVAFMVIGYWTLPSAMGTRKGGLE